MTFPLEIGDVRSAYLFASGAQVDAVPSEGAYHIDFPRRIIDPIDTIVVLELSAEE